jgi:enoyl-CoA hydratase/carnithine racemase
VTTSSDHGIRVRADAHIARITLDRPEQHNALQAADVAAFKAALDEIEATGDARVLIVTGTGDSTFCSGASLDQMRTGEMSGAIFETLTNRLAGVRLPTICALNGSVYGGGAEIALACDFRVGVSGSLLSVPAARLGVCYPPDGLARYVQRLGIGTTNRILLAAEELDATEMLRTGFLTDLVAPDELGATVRALAERIAGLAPLATRAMKQILRGISGGTIDREEATRLIAVCSDSADLQEGLRAHDEGRTPEFEGR